MLLNILLGVLTRGRDSSSVAAIVILLALLAAVLVALGLAWGEAIVLDAALVAVALAGFAVIIRASRRPDARSTRLGRPGRRR